MHNPVVVHRVCQIEILLYLCGFACLLQNEKTSTSSAPKVGGQRPPPKVNEVLGHLFWFCCFFRWTFDLIKNVTDFLKCRCKGKFKNLRFQEITPFYLMMRSFQLLKKNLQLEMSLFRILVCCCINFGLVNGIENILFSLRKLIQVSY